MKLEKEQIGEYFIASLDEADLPKDDPWYRDDFCGADAWCTDRFGPQDLWGEPPVTGWKRMRNKYFFTKEDQLTFFVLYWS